MEHATTIVHGQKNDPVVREIWKVTIILSVLTIIELALGLWMMGMPEGTLHYSIKGAIVILMLAKAFYIVGYFMHLKHELRNMIMTVVVPLLLFVWFILAFLADGHSFNSLKNRYNFYYKDHTSQKMEEKKEEPKESPEKTDKTME